MPKIEIRIGDNSFSAEGEPSWLEARMNAFLERVFGSPEGTTATTKRRGRPVTTTTAIDKKMSAAEVIKTSRVTSDVERAVMLGYWLEKIEGKPSWGRADIVSAFDAAKLRSLSNASRTIGQAVAKGHVRGEGSNCSLTQSGEAWVEQQLMPPAEPSGRS